MNVKHQHNTSILSGSSKHSKYSLQRNPKDFNTYLEYVQDKFSNQPGKPVSLSAKEFKRVEEEIVAKWRKENEVSPGKPAEESTKTQQLNEQAAKDK